MTIHDSAATVFSSGNATPVTSPEFDNFLLKDLQSDEIFTSQNLRHTPPVQLPHANRRAPQRIANQSLTQLQAQHTQLRIFINRPDIAPVVSRYIQPSDLTSVAHAMEHGLGQLAQLENRGVDVSAQPDLPLAHSAIRNIAHANAELDFLQSGLNSLNSDLVGSGLSSRDNPITRFTRTIEHISDRLLG